MGYNGLSVESWDWQSVPVVTGRELGVEPGRVVITGATNVHPHPRTLHRSTPLAHLWIVGWCWSTHTGIHRERSRPEMKARSTV